jgi:copper chaperone
LKVPDMSCGHCKAAVEGELNKLPGVERANADVGRGTVEVSYDESSVGTEQLIEAIEEAGYTVAA